jgi:lipoprotein-releasing system permease protein
MFQPVPVFVGLRYSLAREHSFFVSFITWVSLLGVALGVAALITVLSVMNGFESELRDRLLSLSAHATLTAGGAADRRLARANRAAQGAPGLVGAAPFLDTDAMLSRPPSMSGAIVRGIDPNARDAGVDHRRRHARGQAQRPQAGMNRIILGRMLAYQLQVGVGDSVTVMIPGGSAAGNGIIAAIAGVPGVGIFEVGCRSTTACWRSSICRMPRRFAELTAPPAYGSSSTMC